MKYLLRLGRSFARLHVRLCHQSVYSRHTNACRVGVDLGDKKLEISSGRFARFADGAAVVQVQKVFFDLSSPFLFNLLCIVLPNTNVSIALIFQHISISACPLRILLYGFSVWGQPRSYGCRYCSDFLVNPGKIQF
uniref:Polyribonucleotide nucleotidyltransferase 1 n=1 Tax=Neolamprologus brichardi TaxID=32507 RepID=A0A3Q4H1U8_NEOBR